MAENLRTDRPVFYVKALPQGKGAQPLDLSESVLSFEYEDHESRADKCTIKVDNWNLEQFDNPIWSKGTILEVVWGYPGNLTNVHRVVVQKISGGRALSIQCHGLAMLMHKIKRSRVWNNMTLAEIAQKVAQEYTDVLSVTKNATNKAIVGAGSDQFGNLNIKLDPSVDKKVAHRVQAAETDAAFLSRLARRHGAQFYVDGQGVHFKERNIQQSPLNKIYTWFNGAGELLDFEIENDVTARAGSVTKKGIDPHSKKIISHTADNDSTKRNGLAPKMDIIATFDPKTGAHGFKTRAAESHTEHTSEASAAGAKAHAEGKFKETQLHTVKLSFKAVGDPQVLAKRVIEFRGLGKRLSGKYYIKSVTHTIDNGGYSISGKAHTDGHGAIDAPKSKASLNKKEPTEKMEQVLKFDHVTGTESLTYRKKSEEHH